NNNTTFNKVADNNTTLNKVANNNITMSQVANNINNCSDKTTLDGIDISQYEELRPPYPLMFNAMVKQNEKGRKKCDMPTLSKIASIFWRQEPPHIKNSYKKLAKDAQDLFAKQIDLLQTINAGKSSIKPIDYNPLFNPSGQWSTNDRHCLNVYTPPPNSVVVPFYDVWIRWNKTNECGDPVTPLTNFILTLHNNPKNENNADSPKIKSEWEHPITYNVKEYQYEWKVPLIEEGVVKNMSLFYIRVSTDAVLSSGSFTVSGVAGPFTIWTMPDKENKTLYAPQEKPNNLTNNGELIATRKIFLENIV
ncbi:7334_t:CDS:2, partial [Ambispora leptoticha]